MQGAVDGLVQIRRKLPGLRRVLALVRIPDIGEHGPVLRGGVPADRVDDAGIPAPAAAEAVDDLIVLALFDEAARGLGHAGGVVGMGVAEQIPLHDPVGLLERVILEQVAKTLGDRDGDREFVQALIHDKGDLQHLQGSKRLVAESVFLHRNRILSQRIGQIFIILL